MMKLPLRFPFFLLLQESRTFTRTKSHLFPYGLRDNLYITMSTKKRKLSADGGTHEAEEKIHRVVSYGILLYRERQQKSSSSAHDLGNKEDDNDDGSNEHYYEFLLGLIPQRNWWTVFKGLPNVKSNGERESPFETAVREFEEETGSSGLLPLQDFAPLATLHGRAGKKHLEIFLQEGSFFADADKLFCLEKVVTIDNGTGGYMNGQPEIVAVQWMTLSQALKGVQGAKIYKSQESILQQAHEILRLRSAREQNMKNDGT